LTPEQALQTELRREAGVSRLGRMTAIESLRRNLANEDEAVRRNIERHERELAEGEEQPSEGEAEMGLMVAGDLHYHQPPPAPTPAPAAPKGMGTLAKAGLLAAGLAAGGGLGAGAAALLAPDATPTATVQPDPESYELRLLPP
jgi:hypothetical protein